MAANFVELINEDTPVTPTAGVTRVFVDASKKLSTVDDVGLVTEYGSGGGDMFLASIQTVSGLKTFLNGKFALRNVANTFSGVFSNAITAARTWTMQDADGTVAFTSDLTGKQNTSEKDATGGYVGLTLFKINFKNAANTFTNFFTNATTAARTYTFPDKDITVAGLVDITGTNSGTNTGDNAPLVVNAQTGTTYTFVAADQGKLVTAANAAATTYTIPTNASVAFPVGTVINVTQIGAGKVTFAAAGGVTLHSSGGLFSIGAQYVGVSIIQIAADSWVLVGSLIA